MISNSTPKVVTSIEELEKFLFQQRGITTQTKATFFDPLYSRDIHDPFLIYGMDVAVDRIKQAVAKKEHILIYGDYDVDGMTSTSILMSALKKLGARVTPYLPDRLQDGYGVNLNVMKKVYKDIDLLLTVDCGVSNKTEIAWLNEQGKDTIIIDHHELPAELPDAVALLHPRHPQGKYPWPDLCGAAMAWKFAQAILPIEDAKWLMDLAMLGTIADMMPLLGENRTIVQFGLEVLKRTRRPGLRTLAERMNIDLSALHVDDLGYSIIPALNAPGRIAHPQVGLDVLLAEDKKSAQDAVEQLVTCNNQRRNLTERIHKHAVNLVDPTKPVLFAWHEEWQPGVVGLVAGRLSRKFSKPAVVIGSNGNHGVGSARSVEGVNILEALQAGKEYLIKLGGHKQAAGFSVEHKHIKYFEKAVQQFLVDMAINPTPISGVQADLLVEPHLLTWDTYELFRTFQPFGKANPNPLVQIKGIPLLRYNLVGKDKTHIKCVLLAGNTPLDAIGFGLADVDLTQAKQVDVVGALDVNTWQGRASLQLRLEAISPA